MKSNLTAGLVTGITLIAFISAREWDRLVNLFRNYPDQFSALVALGALVASLLVAMLSIRFTVHALRLQHEHNLKSVIPFASIHIRDYEDDLKVIVSNSGIGPMVVERFTVFSTSVPNQKKDNVVDWMPELPNGMYYSHFVKDINGWYIAPNTEVMIFQLEGDLDDERFAAFRDKVRGALSELIVSLEYRDVYDRKMPSQTQDFRWFGRLLANPERKQPLKDSSTQE